MRTATSGMFRLLAELSSKKNTTGNFLNYIWTLVPLMAGAAAFFAAGGGIATLLEESRAERPIHRDAWRQAQREIDKLRDDQAKVRQRLEALAGSPVDLNLQSVKSEVAALGGRLTAIEIALAATPERAIALPILKQEVDALRERHRADTENDRAERELMKWLIGLMFTVILSVAAPVLSNLRKPARKRKRSVPKGRAR